MAMVVLGDGDECWEFMGARNPEGYGQFWVDGKVRGAHVVAYELLVGPIPEGLKLDHICHNEDAECRRSGVCTHRACVNPAHLQPVAHSVNVRRSVAGDPRVDSHCAQGHELTPDNLYISPSGRRQCRRCVADAATRYKERIAA